MEEPDHAPRHRPERHRTRATRAEEFDQLYRSHRERVRRYVAGQIPHHEIDDVVATTFATAWRRFDELPDEEPRLALWLVRTAHLITLNARRARRRGDALVARIEVQTDARSERTEPDPLARQLEPYVADALNQLTPEDRYLVIATVWEGQTVSELAAALGCTPGAARTRLSRARTRLRHFLRLQRAR